MSKTGRIEFDLIARIRARVRDSDPALLVGIGDDAAVFLPTPGLALVATTDSLVADRHFRSDWPASDLGHLALAVNLSDLAAMGARSRWALLSLTLPEPDENWLEGFLDGFLALAESSGTSLVGGNLASGPLNLGVQLIGEIEPDRLTLRRGARVGDRVLVTGTIGDAAAALALGSTADALLHRRLRRPDARLEAGQHLAGAVSAMVDVSDGLLADLGHLLEGGFGAEIELSRLPASRALESAVPASDRRWSMQLSGGNDYELLVAAPAEKAAGLVERLNGMGLRLTDIGRITGSGRIECRRPDGTLFESTRSGWDHFDDRD